MAITKINFSDNFTSLINKTNEMSTNIGDIDNLITGDSTVIDGLNTVKQFYAALADSSSVVNTARDGFSVVNQSGDGSLAYDSDTGVFTYVGPSPTEIRTHFSSGYGVALVNGQYSLVNGSITSEYIVDSVIGSSKFADKVTFKILDSDGAILKTLFSPGS